MDESQLVLYRLRNVRKTYTMSASERPALDINKLDILRNRVIAILGYSGSGKTTLLNILGLLDTPDLTAPATQPVPDIRFYGLDDPDGRSKGCGYDLVADRAQLINLRKQAFGFVFQDSYLLKNLSSQSNISIPLFINGCDPDQSPLERYFANVDLTAEEFGHRLPSELSGGQAQRVALIRSLVHNPRVLLADEPSSRLDQEHGWQVMNWLAKWCHGANNRTLIWVTHNLEQAAEFADHIIVLRDGQVVISEPNRHHDEAELLQWMQHRPGTSTEEAAMMATPVATVTEEHDWHDIPMVRAARPGLNLLRFIGHFALSDMFPQSHKRSASGKGWFWGRAIQASQPLLEARKTQGLSILALFMVLLLALFFADVSVWLKNYFVASVSDPRINSITINAKTHGDLVLSHQDMEKLSTLAWVDDPAQGWVISWDESMQRQNLAPKRRAIIGAYGSRSRVIDFYVANEKAGWAPLIPLDIVAMHIDDPLLNRIELLSGTTFDTLTPSGQTLASLFESDQPNRPDALPGVILTRESLEKDLEYRDAIPATIPINLRSKRQAFPLLGICEWLPFGASGVITSGWYEQYFHELIAGDPLPGYDRITVYINDMLTDGLPLAERLSDMRYQTTEDVRSRLTWIKNLTDFIFWAALLAISGIAILVAGTLAVSYTQAVRKKQHEIGVLLAHGISKTVLHVIFLCEIVMVWAIAVICVLPIHAMVAWLLKQLMVGKLTLETNASRIFTMPVYVDLAIYGVSLLLAIGAVVWAVHRTLQGHIADILKTAE